MSKRKPPPTEQTNPRTRHLDQMSTRQILTAINDEDARVAAAVRREIPRITKAVDAITAALVDGGRLFYVGAGTSGRLGVLDAAEIPPTFQFPASRVRGIIAGGSAALRRSVEGAEDSEAAGARDLRKHKIAKRDIFVGLAASGTTPYVIGAIRHARRIGAVTIGVTCNPGTPVLKAAQIKICATTGPEAVAGSTRLKAGTAQKMILNMLSTATMVRLGHIYRNLMVNVQMTNAKLRRRGLRILRDATGCTEARAKELIRLAHGNLKLAIVMQKKNCSAKEAAKRLRDSHGHVAKGLATK